MKSLGEGIESARHLKHTFNKKGQVLPGQFSQITQNMLFPYVLGLQS